MPVHVNISLTFDKNIGTPPGRVLLETILQTYFDYQLDRLQT